MVVIACVQYREEMLIGVGDINPDGQHFQIFCQFDKQQVVRRVGRPVVMLTVTKQTVMKKECYYEV